MLQAQVRSAMEDAFWDSIASGLAQKPTDYKRVVSLVGEVREELEAIVPEEWKVELQESMDLELIAQVSHYILSSYLSNVVGYSCGDCWQILLLVLITDFVLVDFGIWNQ